MGARVWGAWAEVASEGVIEFAASINGPGRGLILVHVLAIRERK
jgi:hypothetical protein